MAKMYTQLTGSETKGEELLYTKFKNSLEDSFLIWHNIVIPGKGRELDFIILHPIYGLWVVEVKDWVLSQFADVDQHNVKLKNKLGLTKSKKNPLFQARENWVIIKELLEKHDELLNTSEGIHKDKIKFALNYFVAFPNIDSHEFLNTSFTYALPQENILFSDFISDGLITEDEWTKKIIDLRQKKFDSNISYEEVNLIKKLLGTQSFDKSGSTLDSNQVKLTEKWLDEQIVIEGPAGSGKSIVLIRRAIKISIKNPNWEIGVFCFNALMATYLRIILINQEEYDEVKNKIHIFDFYSFVKNKLKVDWRNFIDPESAVESAFILNGNQINEKFNAILVDEGQDCSDVQIKIYRSILGGNSFTFFYDNRQILYDDKKILNQLSDFGFDISKEKPLVKQQRSSLIALALSFYDYNNNPFISEETIISNLNKHISRMFGNIKDIAFSVASGIKRIFSSSTTATISKSIEKSFFLFQKNSINEIVEDIIFRIDGIIQDQNSEYNDILILYPKRKVEIDNESIEIPSLVVEQFIKHSLPITNINKKNGISFDGNDTINQIDNRRNDSALQSNTTKLMTLNTSKGFDSKYVFIIGFDFIDFSNKASSLGYVGLTRTKDTAYCYYIDENEIISNLKKAKSYIMKNFNV